MNASLPPIDLSSDVDPWERQEHQETPYRFGQFSVYLDLGRTRTLRKVAETLTRSHGYVRQVSASYRWVERAEAWDKHRKHLDELLWIEERRKAAANDNRVLSAIVGQLATRVQIEFTKKRGRVVIEFGSADDLERIVSEIIGSGPGLAPD